MPFRFVRLLVLVVFTGSALLAGAAPAGPKSSLQPIHAVEGIAEYRLKNGLQVLLIPDASKPTTTVNLTYRVGSRHENYGETGMAHLLEHLMFKGSKRHPQVWAEFNKRGLAANGTTSFDRTNYFASFAADDANLKWYLSWQADAMVNSFIAKKDLDSEMTVVRNEMESGENDPGRILWQRALATMFDWHNYGKPTIGARSDVENVDIARLKAFYRRYYQPDNATLIVSGTFDVARTLRWIEQAFARIPKPRRVLPHLYTLEAAQDGERSFTLQRTGGVPMLLAAYHMPAAADPQFAAVEALALILADEPSGRMHQRLVRTQLAASVWGWAWDLADPGAIMLGAQLAPGQDVQAAGRELVAAIESFATEPVSAAELARAKAKWLKEWNLRFSDAQKVGVALSEAVAQGDWRLFFLLRDRVQALSVEQVQRVAVERLLPSNRTLGRFEPADKPQRAPAPQPVDVARQLQEFKPRAGLAHVEAFDPTPKRLDAATRRSFVSDGADGRLEVALLPKPTRGAVAQARLVLRLGDELSLARQSAVAELLAAVLDKGSTTRSRQQVQDRLDELQSELSIGAEPGSLTVALTSRRESLPALIGLVGDLLRRPALAPEALDEVKRQALAGVEAMRREPEALVENTLARHGNPYPAGDPRYARSFDEIKAEIEAVTPERLREFHDRFMGASSARFAAVGDMDAAAVTAALEQVFGGWKSSTAFARIARPLVLRPGARLVERTPDKQNAVLMMRQALPLSDRDAEAPAFMVANWLLGGSGGDSRLWKRVREKEGLSYGIQSSVTWNPHEANSSWTVWAMFAPDNRAKVETAIGEEVTRALNEGFSAQEVRAGINGLLRFRKLARAQDARLAGSMASHLDLGRTFAHEQRIDDAIRRLEPAQVAAALRKYLLPGQFVTAVAGDFKEP